MNRFSFLASRRSLVLHSRWWSVAHPVTFGMSRRFCTVASSVQQNDAISGDTFGQLMDKLNVVNAPFGIALSGGPDSSALCLLAHAWASKKSLKMVAFSVDHRVQSGSTDEVLRVNQEITTRGIEHYILTCRWEGGKPPSGGKLQIQCRSLRYQLLSDACKQHGLKFLLTAHHRDDQIETFFLRVSHLPGIDGLVGMDPVTLLGQHVTLVRPLLTVPKAQLIATCDAFNFPFSTESESNRAMQLRSGIRQALKTTENTLPAEKVLATIERLRAAKAAMLQDVKVFFSHSVLFMGRYCTIYLRVDTFRKISKPIGLRSLGAVVHRIHPDRLLRHEPLDALYKEMWDALDKKSMKFSISGVLFFKAATRLPQVLVCREPEAIPDTKSPIKMHERVMWDNYYFISCMEPHEVISEKQVEKQWTGHLKASERSSSSADPFTIGYIRKIDEKDLNKLYDVYKWEKRLPLPRPAMYCLPLIEDGRGNMICIPHIGFNLRGDVVWLIENKEQIYHQDDDDVAMITDKSGGTNS